MLLRPWTVKTTRKAVRACSQAMRPFWGSGCFGLVGDVLLRGRMVERLCIEGATAVDAEAGHE